MRIILSFMHLWYYGHKRKTRSNYRRNVGYYDNVINYTQKGYMSEWQTSHIFWIKFMHYKSNNWIASSANKMTTPLLISWYLSHSFDDSLKETFSQDCIWTKKKAQKLHVFSLTSVFNYFIFSLCTTIFIHTQSQLYCHKWHHNYYFIISFLHIIRYIPTYDQTRLPV